VPFSQIFGHHALLDLLRRSVDRRRVPQSLLFAGPDGVGKRTTALAMAQALNCPKQAHGDACGTCGTCTRIEKGQFSDVVLIEKGDEASLKIDVVRARLLEQIGYRPFEGTRRVFIIDPADDLTEQAQDALLKTLEEPPPSAIIVLISAYPDTLLATIRSRCRRLRFGALTEADVARVLIERRGFDPVAARARAAASGGSVARALDIEEDEFDDDRAAAMGMLEAAARGTAPSERLKAGAAFAKHAAKRRAREAAATRLAILASLLRDLGSISAGGGVALANADLDDQLRRLAGAYPVDRVAGAFAAVEQAESALGRNASTKIVADWLAVSV
jgi:DNA polymerase-3 subunit delta'